MSDFLNCKLDFILPRSKCVIRRALADIQKTQNFSKNKTLRWNFNTRKMDDERIQWIQKQVFLALDIKELEVFEELLDRDDGLLERQLGKFLNDTPEENESSVLFYKITKEEEEEVEVECGKYVSVLIKL